MNILPIKVDSEKIYEHRHLYTDDVKYNSLIISNLFSKQINLFDYDSYKKHKNIVIIKYYNRCKKYILSKHGVYELQSNGYIINWQDYQETFSHEYDNQWYSHLLLTIV